MRTYTKEGLNKAATTEDEIHYTYTVTNDGLLTLYNISVQAEELMANNIAITCVDTDSKLVEGPNIGISPELASYPDEGLAPATSIMCTAIDSVSQEEVGNWGGNIMVLIRAQYGLATWQDYRQLFPILTTSAMLDSWPNTVWALKASWHMPLS